MEKLPRLTLLWHKMRRVRPGSIENLPVSGGVPEIRSGSPDYRKKIQIKYLGAGGYLIKRGDDAILTAPFFSNPSLPRMLFWRIKCHSEEVDRFLASLTEAIQDVEAILVGHAHYDHLMDVPHLAEKYAKKARIYGNQTMAHILAPFFPSDSDRLVALDGDAASEPPDGFPPPFSEPESRRRVDLAILCVAGFMEVSSYPEEIIRKLNPRFVILGHWENLFKPLPNDPRDLRVAPTVDAKEFVVRLKRVLPVDARFEMPAPGAWMQFL